MRDALSGAGGAALPCALLTSKGALSTLTRHAGFALMRHKIHINWLDIGWMNSDHERKLVLSETGDLDFIDRAAAASSGRILDLERGGEGRALDGVRRWRHDDRCGHSLRSVGLWRL